MNKLSKAAVLLEKLFWVFLFINPFLDIINGLYINLIMGVGIYASSFFTALNNGLVSAVISFLRTLVFQVAAILVLPGLFGLDGVWWAIVAAEALGAAAAAMFLIRMKKHYGY